MRSDLLNVTDIERRFGVIDKKQATCSDHGDYVAVVLKHSAEPSGCPKCAELRQKALEQAEREEQKARNAAARLERKLGSTMIPKRFQGRTFDGYQVEPGNEKQARALRICRDYADNFDIHFAAGRCLLLLGKPGTGKTHLAAAIACQIARCTGHTAVYRTIGGILQYIKGSYGDSDYSEADAFASLVEPSLLIIDEIGATKPSEFELAVLFQIINGRYEEQKPTVIVSNLEADELAPAIGERCIDRLREGGGKAVPFVWQSARSGL